ALIVGDIAENNGPRRTGLGAGGSEAVGRNDDIARGASFGLLRDFGLLDALDAEGAFLHHPAHTDRHVRVFGHLHQVPLVVFAMAERAEVKLADGALVPIEEIEPADLVRAVI